MVFMELSLLVTAASAQESPLDALVTKPQITRQDRGVLNAEVAQRVKRLNEGGPKLDEARERILKPARTSGASKAFLEAYAEACAKELSGTPNSDDFDLALAATLILLDFDQPGVVEPLAGALSSKYPGVRYLAIQGLRKRTRWYADNQELCSTVLKSIARAAAAERDPLVARPLFAALVVRPASGDFKHAALGASVVAEVLDSTMQGSAEDRGDEQIIRSLCEAAAAYYPAARPEDRAAMARAVLELLRRSAARVFDPTAEAQAAAATRQAELIEGTLLEFMNQSKATPPKRKVSDALKGRAADSAKAEAEVRVGLAELKKVLQGEPWNLP